MELHYLREHSHQSASFSEVFKARLDGKVCDKWAGYLPVYDGVVARFNSSPVRMLEIGVQNGGSLEVWAQCLPKAEAIIGVDIVEGCGALQYEDRRIKVVVGSAVKSETEAAIAQANHHNQFDIIVDDGSHLSLDIIAAFARWWPHLAVGGVYVVEDLHASYWREFGGGLFYPYSAMAFFKRLADCVNREHWDGGLTLSETLQPFADKANCTFDEPSLMAVGSITFTNSLCLVQKVAPASVLLGDRLYSGTERPVVQHIASLRPKIKSDIWSSPSSNDAVQERIASYQGGYIWPLIEPVLRMERSIRRWRPWR